MSENLPDVAAFQVFLWNKRRYAIPVNAKGEQLGPALPFRNANRKKRHGYGPGSANTSLCEDSSSSLPLLQPPADAAAPLLAQNASSDSQSTNSSPGRTNSSPERSSRQRLSRTVSFLDKTTLTATAKAAGVESDAPTRLVEFPKSHEVLPASILQKKSSFLITLRPLFDFDYEPPHTPREAAKDAGEIKSVKAETPLPEDVLEAVGVKSRPQKREKPPCPSSSLPLMAAITADPVRPHTPPAPHRSSDLNVRFVRGSNTSAASLIGREVSLAPKEVNRNTIRDGSPSLAARLSPTTLPEAFTEDAAKPVAASAHAALLEAPAGFVASITTPPTPASQGRAPSPMREVVALVRTTVRSPSPDDLFYCLKRTALSITPEGERTVAAPSVSPAMDPELSLSTQITGNTASRTHTTKKKKHHQHRSGSHKREEEVLTGEQAAAAFPTENLQEGDGAEVAPVRGREEKKGKGSADEEKEKIRSSAKHDTNGEDPSTHKKGEVHEEEELLPKYSDFLSPPRVAAVATTATTATSNDRAQHVTTPESLQGARCSISPAARSSPELGHARISSALSACVEDRTKANGSPSAGSNGDWYGFYRSGSPQPMSPKKSTASVQCTGAPQSTVPSSSEKTKRRTVGDAVAAVAAPGSDLSNHTYDYAYAPLDTATPTPPGLLPMRQPSPGPHHTAHEILHRHISDGVSRSSLLSSYTPPTPENTLTGEEGVGKACTLPSLTRHPVPPTYAAVHHQLPPQTNPAHTLPPFARIRAQSICTMSSSDGSGASTSHDSSSMSVHSRMTVEGDKEVDENSATSFSMASSEDDSLRSPHSRSCTPTNESQSTTTTATTTTTTSSSSDLRRGNQGSIWSNMMRRLRQPLITRPPTGEDPLMYQLNRYRNKRTLAKSRVQYGSRVETRRGVQNGLSSVETRGRADPLFRRRREKREASLEPSTPRRRGS